MMSTVENALSENQAVEKKAVNYKVILGASLGNGLEIFDFTVYSFFAAIIGELYFPSDTAYGSLLMSVAVFGVGFIMRPLGSMVLGAYADKVGRKAAMLMTIILMGVGTALIAFSPTHAQIGVFAPILIVVGRLIQGFAAGGEVGSATTLLLESAGANQRGFFVSWQSISQGISALLGASFGLLLTYFLSEEALYSWGWRVPFIIGLLIIPVGVYIRRHLEETYGGEAPGQARSPSNPVLDVLRNHFKDLLLGVLIIMSGTVMVYIVLLYMPTYMMQTYHIAGPTAYLFSCIASVVQIAAAYYAGRYVDRVQNYKRPLLFSIFAALILIYPTFWFLSATQSLWLAIVFRILLIGTLGINMLASTMLIVSALPRHVRATGTSMIYAFGVTLFGGSAQLIVTWLLDVSGNPMAPAWYVTGMLTLSLIATCLFRERHQD
ncbi:Proline porter II [Serratia entomophila]|uniref:MFS transporter n=2 Tax=Serratia entomophila TaxID=42906 RepID=A0ABY5CW94_9GAMM|nr:MFS transporter [Serratia entomophila]USV02366.1 MFS transporter [Serratia entomophila]CAI0766531.1 Proline porter II [Serratia entomophila]CAI0770712.1 Proline porter II [Serratia entomophila]CAI0788910.1 Proline porter II [Serratia entomophila]